ncbi:VWA domain-containing protein [Haliangium sp.]|uniref:VWA domain-containing protein n=1 Tax=Haliangium sp. TaxID=2663208 RepID=UPI003D0EB94B
MRSVTKRLLLAIALGVVAAVAIAVAIELLLAPRVRAVVIPWGERPIELLEPTWLYLCALAPFFFVVRTSSLTDLSLTQQIVQSGVRTLLLAGIALALARPAWTSEDDKVATVILVDVSESVSDEQLDAARGYVTALAAAKTEDDHLQVVTFAERPRLVRPDGDGDGDGNGNGNGNEHDPEANAGPGEGASTSDLAAAIQRHRDAGKGTDIQAAVQLAYGLFPAGYLPRIIILSDGNQTSGDLLSEAYRAEELGVRLSWQTFPQDRVEEIRVAGLRIPDEVKVGAPFEVTAEIWSTHEDEITLSLRQDDFPNPLEPKKTVTLHEGKNQVTFKSQAARAGFTTYRLRMDGVEHDTESANNEAVMTTPVKGRPRVLYVEGSVMREPSSAGYLARALDHENIDVEVRGPRGLPSTAKELERYDLVLVSDVPAHFVGMAQMAALERYLRDLGGGLIMAGGEDSFGSGGYQGTRMEKIMPVRFDSEKQREQPSVAIALVVDRSGSMSGPKIEAAKASARATAEVLSPSDLITVIAFDNQPTTVVRLQRASNRTRIATDIARLSAGGGTSIYPALREAYEGLQGANAKVKHVIVLSDGQAPYEGIADLCQEMRGARITVSAVGIGDADRNLLSLITDNGDGRLYMTDDLAALPRIFMKETTEAQRAALVEDNIKAHVLKRVEMIEGTGVENAPLLRGYVSTKPKPRSEVVLVSDLGEPILARWRVGTGTSVAWTSDVKNRWSVDWIRWNGYPKFWAQVVRTTMRRKVHESYDLYARVEGGQARVVVDAIDNGDQFVDQLDTTLEVIDPRTSQVERRIPMEQTAAGRYSADFSVDRYGSYMLKAVHRRDGQVVAESMGAVALSYPLEYLRTSPDTAPLVHAAEVSGGLSRPTPDRVFDAMGESIRYTEDLWPWVLLLVAGLLLLDLYLKRLRIFGYRTIKF